MARYVRRLSLLAVLCAVVAAPAGAGGCTPRGPEGDKPTVVTLAPLGHVEAGPTNDGRGYEAGWYDNDGNYLFVDGTPDTDKGLGVGGRQFGVWFFVGTPYGMLPAETCVS